MGVTGIRISSSHHWGQHKAVGMSSLFFGIPSCAFVAINVSILDAASGKRPGAPPLTDELQAQVTRYWLLTLLYAGTIVTSGLADFVYIKRGHRSFYGKIDFVYAACVFLFSNYDFCLRAGPLETCVVSGIAVLAFLFSGSSKSFEQWVFRHSLWHGVAGAIGTYGAMTHQPPEYMDWHHWALFGLFLFFYSIFATMFVTAMLSCNVEFNGLKDRFAKYAAWTPVAREKEG